MTTTVRLVACALTAIVLTGCTTAGPRRALTELELKQAADVRVCNNRTGAYGLLPWGGLVRTVEFDKCMQKRGWDVLSAMNRQALYGTTDVGPPPPPALAPSDLPMAEPAWDVGL